VTSPGNGGSSNRRGGAFAAFASVSLGFAKTGFGRAFVASFRLGAEAGA